MAPSLTAAGVARARARMARPATSEGDPDGEQRLNVDLGADTDDAPGPMFHHLAARTRFFDDLTLTAVEGDTVQIVIVGAGYDCRALRFRRAGVRFFELDHPATQRDKQERLARLAVDTRDIVYVPLDLTAGDVDVALAEAGHDATRSSLFICEGLLLYLDTSVITSLFRGARKRTTGSATLALSLALRRSAMVDPAATLRRNALHRRLRAIGEPPRTTLRRDEWDALLARTGWKPDRVVEPRSIDPEATAGGSLLMTAEPADSRSAH